MLQPLAFRVHLAAIVHQRLPETARSVLPVVQMTIPIPLLLVFRALQGHMCPLAALGLAATFSVLPELWTLTTPPALHALAVALDTTFPILVLLGRALPMPVSREPQI